MPIAGVIEAHTECRGTIVILHGLNISPLAFSDFAAAFAHQGYRSILAALSGHEGKPENLHAVTAQKWKSDFHAVLSEVQRRDGALPMHVLAYSLGGLVATAVLARDNPFPVRSMALIAPALRLRWWVRIPQPLTLLHPLRIPLPSGVPPAYRASPRTSLAWFHALLSLHDEVQRIPVQSALGEIPSLIMAARHDEFMKLSHIRQWVEQNRLIHWNVAEIPARHGFRLLPHHLVIDRHSLGEERWAGLATRVIDFFNSQRAREAHHT